MVDDNCYLVLLFMSLSFWDYIMSCPAWSGGHFLWLFVQVFKALARYVMNKSTERLLDIPIKIVGSSYYSSDIYNC